MPFVTIGDPEPRCQARYAPDPAPRDFLPGTRFRPAGQGRHAASIETPARLTGMGGPLHALPPVGPLGSLSSPDDRGGHPGRSGPRRISAGASRGSVSPAWLG